MKIVLWIVGSVIALVCVLFGQSITIPLGAPTPSLMRWPDGNPIRIGFGLAVTSNWLYATGGGSGGGGLSNLTAGIIPLASSASSLTNSGIKANRGHIAFDEAQPDVIEGTLQTASINVMRSITTNINPGEYRALNIELYATNTLGPITQGPYAISASLDIAGTNTIPFVNVISSGVSVTTNATVPYLYNGSFRSVVIGGSVGELINLFGYAHVDGGAITDMAFGGFHELVLSGDRTTTVADSDRFGGGMLRVKHLGGDWEQASAGVVQYGVDVSGTVTNANGLLILSAAAGGSASMENFAGIRVHDQTAAANNYAFYSGRGVVHHEDTTEILISTPSGGVGDVTAVNSVTTVNQDTTFESVTSYEGMMIINGIPNPGAELYGVAFSILPFGTNSYHAITTFNAQFEASEDVVVTNAYGFHIRSALASDASVIQNFYGIKVDDQFQPLNAFALHTGLGKVQLGDAVTLSHTLSAHTNIAPFTLLTNAVVVDTLYTNRNQRATVYQAYNLTSALLSAAAIDLYVDDDGNGTWDSIGLGLAAPGGVTNVLKQILSFPVQPGGRYAVSNSSGAGSTVAAAGPSRIVFQ